ncbi:flagellar biosynthetic protein FliR [Luteitalea sp. TBR-22]|uniref:flagellar biosynthetic protein FliR n=1 Tax=Luteitalea sp. TBR-22 TaxID=2802971 RepID=UPI001AFB5D7D|nr:flagellar biosynthetic protein FliR [Luteitalea sp. TBR-22]BCS33530.1 flagellar biosynthetic protein FliR [Luteitalea sp. TBR-22]
MDLSPLLVFVIALIRPSLIVMATPLYGGTYAPTMAKIGLLLVLAAFMAPVIGVPRTLASGMLIAVMVREALIGLALAMTVRLLQAGAELGGYLTGFQMGLSYAALVDPQSGVRNNVLAALYGSITVIVLLVTNAHHELLRALAASYEALPIGGGAVATNLAEMTAGMFGLMFTLGVRLSAPIVITLLLVEVGLGVMARVAPTLNLMVTAAPVRLLIGWMALALTLRVLPDILTRAFPQALTLGARTAAALH